MRGEFLCAEFCKTGHINETWSATCNQDGAPVRFLLQKINSSVFKDPVVLMQNVMRVTTHIRRKLQARNVADLDRRVLTVVPARDGQPLHRSGDGEYWRDVRVH